VPAAPSGVSPPLAKRSFSPKATTNQHTAEFVIRDLPVPPPSPPRDKPLLPAAAPALPVSPHVQARRGRRVARENPARLPAAPLSNPPRPDGARSAQARRTRGGEGGKR